MAVLAVLRGWGMRGDDDALAVRERLEHPGTADTRRWLARVTPS